MAPDPSASPLLQVEAVCAGYAQRPVLRDIHLTVSRGQLLGVLGPNGAGKSTLLRVCLGLLTPAAGRVRLQGRALSAWSPQALSRTVAWVPQTIEPAGAFTGLELVVMGRHPHQGPLGLASSADLERAHAALAQLGVPHLAERSCVEMSGGERRLIGLARALVQEPQLLVLDEPTAFLDVRHQVDALRAVRTYVAQGRAALAVLHDVNLAAAFADQMVLLRQGKVLAKGRTHEVLTASALEQLFGLSMTQAEADGQALFAPRWRA